jgi:hypothetical protein
MVLTLRPRSCGKHWHSCSPVVYNLPSDILSTLQQKDNLVSNIPEAQDVAVRSIEAKAKHDDDTRSASAASTTACSLCDQLFSTVEEQRSHIRSDLHNYNLKLKLRGLEAVSEIEFESLVKGCILCICSTFWARLMLHRFRWKLIRLWWIRIWWRR